MTPEMYCKERCFWYNYVKDMQKGHLHMNVKIANRLLEYRLAHGLSQEALAEKLGVSRQAVSKWERSEASPDTDNLIALAALYGVLIDELINGEGEPKVAHTQDAAEEATQDAEAAEKSNADTANDFGDIGINIDDGDDKIHIGIRGIHVVEKDGAEVHIGAQGIHISDNDDDDDDDDEDDDGRPNYFGWLSSAMPILCTIAYLVLGFTTQNGWSCGWILYFLVPVVPSLISAIRHRRPSNFAYPVFVAGLYLVAGMCYGRWHPEWVMFLTVPVYYGIAEAIEKLKKRRK